MSNDHLDVAMTTMVDDGDRRERAWREASLEHPQRYQERGRVGHIGGNAHDETLSATRSRAGGSVLVHGEPVDVDCLTCHPTEHEDEE